ncbi:MAG TPA: M17 family peptidase N-terminal domain-containing protein [Polyangiaceae bacterium]|nr:M17 family peptidase N-terminal domain-containing protein [Polyangiaceae bacterium]
MELRYIAPDLRQLDTAGAEVLACAVFTDLLPPKGLLGLVDWRMAARVSRHIETGEISGRPGELVMIPGKPRIPFEKLLLLGAGEARAFDEAAYLDVIVRMLAVLSSLKVRMAVVERPGRFLGVIDTTRAIELLLRASAEQGEQDTWTLVEEGEDQKLIAQHLAEERRRKRMR